MNRLMPLAGILLGVGTAAVAMDPPDGGVQSFHAAMKAANPDYAESKATISQQNNNTAMAIKNCLFQDLTPITKMEPAALSLHNCRADDWAKVGLGSLEVRELKMLDCHGFRDFSALMELPRISRLDLKSDIKNFDALGELRVSMLTISSPNLADIGFVRKMENLRILAIKDCPAIKDFAALGGCGLTCLMLEGENHFSDKDAQVIGKLPALTGLGLRGTQITDLSFLKDCSKITSLQLPDGIKDFKILLSLPKLSSLRVGNGPAKGGWELTSWLHEVTTNPPVTAAATAATGEGQAKEAAPATAPGKEPAPADDNPAQKPSAPPASSPDKPLDQTAAIKAEMGIKLSDVDGSIIVIEHENGAGTGFLARMGDKTYVFTNQHVIVDGEKITMKTGQGKIVKVVEFEVSTKHDVARFRVDDDVAALTFAEKTDIGAPIVVFGNSDGSGVFTEIYGRVQGIGPEKIEISAEVIQGNSGSAIIDQNRQVVGIATYVTQPADDTDWVKAGTRFTQVRRFGLRIGPDHEWQTKDWAQYRQLAKALNEHVEYAEILLRLTGDWFSDPLREFDKSNYPHADAAIWITRHTTALAGFRKVVKKGGVRNERELDRVGQKVYDALTNDYKQLAFLFRKKATEIKTKAAQNEPRMSNYLKEQNQRVAMAMERIAERIERSGDAASRP